MRLVTAALLLCSAVLFGMSSAAMATPTLKQEGPVHGFAETDGRYTFMRKDWERMHGKVRKAQTPRAKRSTARPTVIRPAFRGFGGNGLVAEARKYLGTNPTGRRSLWCGAFMDLVLKRSGYRVGGNLARAYARYGTRVSGPQVGAIAVMRRKGGGHVGVVSGIDSNGNPITVSGNHKNTVAETVYPRGRITAYVMPGS